jgi:hypothetical protein
MRETDMECKVALLLLLYNTYRATLQAVLFVSTRRRKLAADTRFCWEFRLCHRVFFAQTTRWATR